MTNRPISVIDQFLSGDHDVLNRAFVGADRLFDTLRTAAGAYDNYPPFNLEKKSDHEYEITVALAGFSKDDVNVSVEGEWLYIESVQPKSDAREESRVFLHRGIAQRGFKRKIQLANDIKVDEAIMENGLLIIKMSRIIPEELKPRTIQIK